MFVSVEYQAHDAVITHTEAVVPDYSGARVLRYGFEGGGLVDEQISEDAHTVVLLLTFVTRQSRPLYVERATIGDKALQRCHGEIGLWRGFREELLARDASESGRELLGAYLARNNIQLAEIHGVVLVVNHGEGCIKKLRSYVVKDLDEHSQIAVACDNR